MATPRAGVRFWAAARTNMRAHFQRRGQSTAANPAAAEVPKQSLLQRLWTSEVGIKTVHFWAPIMKWGVVAAGVSDFIRPADKLSLTQNTAMIATGAIWTRWCFVIRPKNPLLAAVNFCLFLVGSVQTSRIIAYRAQQEGSISAALKSAGRDLIGAAKEVEKKGKEELKA